ncbi:MAG: ribonuclease P protein component [Clostridia bacterium]|nr:ribonuclease P protein component [Clostridia bacterium]MEE1025073.1 ribonuclease P protein component [Acutalibacteraceae bacterium]
MPEFITLNENREFKRVYNRATSYVSPALVVYFIKNRAGFSRFGITVTKKIGCAVKRNRAKRVIREAIRACAANINGNYDFVLVARTRTAYVKSGEVVSAFRDILKKAGIYNENNTETHN